MAKAYSDDLRRKILEAYDRKAGSLRELAERFGVSYAWARQISWQRRRTGQRERVEQRHGAPSRATAPVAARWRRLLRQPPDRTLRELQQGLWEAAGGPQRNAASAAELLDLPCDSLDFPPIEPCWGKIKHCLRGLQARTVDAQQAISAAIATITPDNASACFRHCEYGIDLT